MSDELDLEHGDPDAAERISQLGSERSRARRATRSKGDSSSGSGTSSGSKSSSSKSGGGKSDASLSSGLGDAFNRLAEQLESRGDDELADAIRKDAEAMTRGIMALTRAATVLRAPILLLVNIAVVFLAFWHVGSILVRRWADRRQRVMAEREAQAAGVGYEVNGQ